MGGLFNSVQAAPAGRLEAGRNRLVQRIGLNLVWCLPALKVSGMSLRHTAAPASSAQAMPTDRSPGAPPPSSMNLRLPMHIAASAETESHVDVPDVF